MKFEDVIAEQQRRGLAAWDYYPAAVVEWRHSLKTGDEVYVSGYREPLNVYYVTERFLFIEQRGTFFRAAFSLQTGKRRGWRDCFVSAFPQEPGKPTPLPTRRDRPAVSKGTPKK